MPLPGWVAAVVLFLQLPIPLYWFVLHPGVKFWSLHQKAAYLTGFLCSWPPVAATLVIFHRHLFRPAWPSAPALVIALALILVELWMVRRVHHDLGTARLVGKTELTGGGKIERSGIYAYIRHPRYTGSFLAIVGACLLGGTRIMWIVAAAWLILTLVAIGMEERELSARFGASYREYCRRVPRFFPSLTRD